MWMHGIFGSQGMIWWWILRSASSHLQKSPQEMSFIFWHRLSIACLPGLWPILLRKSIVRVIRPSMYAQDFFSTNWSTPYQLSTFQLIRFTLIEVLTHITIKPSRTYFVSMHRKRPTLSRTDATLDKRSRAIILFPPIFFFFFFFFIKKKPIKLPLGTDHLVKPCFCFTSTSGSLYCWWLYLLGWDISSAACAFFKYFWAA